MNLRIISIILGVSVVAIVITYIAFYFVFLDLFVDLWWFRSLEFEGYFWLRLLYRFFLSGGVTLFFAAIFFFHFWIASRYLGLNTDEAALLDTEKKERSRRIADLFMAGSLRVYLPLSLILAIVIAIPFYQHWEFAILFFFGDASGVVDPIFNNDVSFYMFSYPIFSIIQQELLVTASIVLVIVAILYWLVHHLVPHQKTEYPVGAKIHLLVLIAFVILFVTWGFYLQRFELLYTDSHNPVYFGPGFVELRYYLPLIWLGMLSFLGLSLSVVVYYFSTGHRSNWPMVGCVLVFFSVLGLQNLQFIPNFLEKYIVQPNPVKVEKTFMENNIKATLAAYKLDEVKTINATIKLDPTEDIIEWKNQRHFENIPLWDRELLVDAFMQLQGIRPYYSFINVDEARYFLNGHITQVNLAARELNVSRLPSEAQSWENIHMRYTHGYGAVVTPTSQDAGKPIEWYLRDLNLHSDMGFKINKPDLYYGQEKYDYAIVPNKLEVLGLAGDDAALSGDYDGKGGVPIRSFFRKLLFTSYFQDEKIFFSFNVSRKSKIRFRRNIVDRVSTLTPFLHLDKDPYLVITNDRLFWILDAYTLSDWYPASTPSIDEFSGQRQRFNYLRNSVKITVDAYDGSINYYIADESDAIVKAYSRAYPGVFKALSEMPGELKKQLRYPRDFYHQQMQIYAKYHQTEPELFYEQAETWEFAKIDEENVKPYYVTTDFNFCNDTEEFVLINPMTPVNRDNLSMIGVASVFDQKNCSDEYVTGISVFKFSKDTQVNGPAQVDALIDQDPEISAQFTLWDQHGSRLVRGRMVILPMDNSVLYVQPIYLISTTTRIPQLIRIILSNSDEVVMAETLNLAFEKLQNKFATQQPKPKVQPVKPKVEPKAKSADKTS